MQGNIISESLAVMTIWNTTCSFIFNTYTAIADLIYDRFIGGSENANKSQAIYV